MLPWGVSNSVADTPGTVEHACEQVSDSTRPHSKGKKKLRVSDCHKSVHVIINDLWGHNVWGTHMSGGVLHLPVGDGQRAVGWGEPPQGLTNSQWTARNRCLGQVPSEEAEELIWTSSHKSWIDATNKWGTKGQGGLIVSLKDGRHRSLNGRSALPPLGAQPSTSSSPHPYSAIHGLPTGSYMQSMYSLGIMAGEQAGKLC